MLVDSASGLSATANKLILRVAWEHGANVATSHSDERLLSRDFNAELMRAQGIQTQPRKTSQPPRYQIPFRLDAAGARLQTRESAPGLRLSEWLGDRILLRLSECARSMESDRR